MGQLLSDLDLHHPPCLALAANQAFYTLAALAYNVLTALKLSEPPADHHGWCVRTLIRHLLTPRPNSRATPAAWFCGCIVWPCI